MTSDVSWSATYEHIKATNLVNPALAQQEFGFFLAAGPGYDEAFVKYLGGELGLSEDRSLEALSFAEQTDDFMKRLAMTSPESAQWDFQSYMQNYWHGAQDIDEAVIQKLSEKAGLSERAREDIEKNISSGVQSSVIPYIQLDNQIAIYGLPSAAILEAKSNSDSKPPNTPISYTYNNNIYRFNVTGVESGHIIIKSRYDENTKIMPCLIRLDFTIDTYSSKTYAKFKQEFGFKKTQLPIGTTIDSNGDLRVPRGEDLEYARVSYNWCYQQGYNPYTLTGVRKGNSVDLSWVKRAYIGRALRTHVHQYYTAIDTAYKAHVAQGLNWTEAQIESVFQNAGKLATALSSQFRDAPIVLEKTLNMQQRNQEYVATISKIMALYDPRIKPKHVGQTLFSAMLSDNFTRFASGVHASETEHHALILLGTFDPGGPAMVFMARKMRNAKEISYKDYLPGTKNPRDPGEYTSYLTRRVLEAKVVPAVGNADVMNAAFGAMAVYLFGVIREIIPTLKKLVFTDGEFREISKIVSEFMVLKDGAIKFQVSLGKETYTNDAAGAFEKALFLRKQFTIRFSQDERNNIRSRVSFLDRTNGWMPGVSAILRIVTLVIGNKAIPPLSKVFIYGRVLADVLMLSAYYDDNPSSLLGFAHVIKSSIAKIGDRIRAYADSPWEIPAAAVTLEAFPVVNADALPVLTASIGAGVLRGAAFAILKIAGFVHKVVNIGIDLADIVYGSINLGAGTIEIMKGKIVKGVGLTVYGAINLISGIAYTARGLGFIRGRWAVPVRTVSFYLQFLASAANAYLATVSAIEAERAKPS